MAKSPTPEFQTICKFHICLQETQEKGIQCFPSGASLAAGGEPPPQERLWEGVRGQKRDSVGRFERERRVGRKTHLEIKIQKTASAGQKEPKESKATGGFWFGAQPQRCHAKAMANAPFKGATTANGRATPSIPEPEPLTCWDISTILSPHLTFSRQLD